VAVVILGWIRSNITNFCNTDALNTLLSVQMILIIREQATPEQMQQMLASLGIYIKLAVDIERYILAGGGELHARL
jgi:hypothetical protein